MSSGTNNTASVAFLPPETDFPSPDNPRFLALLNERERKTGTILNQKEDGVYNLAETVTSQLWFFSPNVSSNGFRKIFIVPSLTAGATTSITHNLGNIASYVFTYIFSVVSDGSGNSFRPLPLEYIEITATEIQITLPGGSPFNGYEGQIVLEYVKTPTPAS